MAWPQLKGHEQVVERFRRAQLRGRLASTFLFVGPPGIGKRTFAIRLAAALLCDRTDGALMEPCGECPACQQVAAGTHPDLEVVSRPPEKSFIPIELLIGDREHRGRAGLCHNIALKPSSGGYRIAIIDDGDDLNVEGANCLLKNLEEPPPKSVLILIATSQSTQLPTIRSRCQVVRFEPLSDDAVAELLVEKELCDSADARELAQLAGGSLELALAQQMVQGFRSMLLDYLSQGAFDSVTAASELTKHVNQAGKEASVRRQSLREVMALATRYYHQLMLSLCEEEEPDESLRVSGDLEVVRAVDVGRESWVGGSENAARCIERCVEAHEQLDSNANLATLIECWIDDLSRLAHGDCGVVPLVIRR